MVELNYEPLGLYALVFELGRLLHVVVSMKVTDHQVVV